jgi:hypothetical protein
MYDNVLLLVHPWVAPTFVSVVDPEWSTRRISEQVDRDVERVVGNRPEWRVRYEFIGTGVILGDRVDRILVTCIPNGALSIGEMLGAPQFEVNCTVAAIASLLSGQSIEASDSQGNPEVIAAIGWYGDRVEVSIHQHGSLRFSAFLEDAGSETSVTRLGALVDSAGLQKSQITRVVLYGHTTGAWDVREANVFSHARIEWLRPSDIFDPTPRMITDDSAFVPVAAGALSRLLSHV